MLSPGLIRAPAGRYQGLLQAGGETASSPRSFKDRGFSFIPLRPAHLEFLGFCYGRPAPAFEECLGRAMVDDRYLPMGVLLVHFEPCGVNALHAHFGSWLRVYPKDILRSVHEVCDILRAHDITILHAIADEAIEGSETLVKWLRAEPTGHRAPTGQVWRIDLNRTPI